MIIVPGGPAQAQFWIDQEKKRRRNERIKKSRKTYKIDAIREKMRKEALEEIYQNKKCELKSKMTERLNELIGYRERLFADLGNFHLSAIEVQKNFESTQFKKNESVQNVKRLIKKTHLGLKKEKIEEFLNKKSKLERKAYLQNIEKFRAAIQARKGFKKLSLLKNKKPVEAKPKYKSYIEYPNLDLKSNAENFLQQVEPIQLAAGRNKIQFEKNRITRGNEALKQVKNINKAAEIIENLDKQAKQDLLNKKLKFNKVPNPKKSFDNIIFELPDSKVSRQTPDVIEENYSVNSITSNKDIESKQSSSSLGSDKNSESLEKCSSIEKLPVQVYVKDIDETNQKKNDSGICVTRSSQLNQNKATETDKEINQAKILSTGSTSKKQEIKNIFEILKNQKSSSKYVTAIQESIQTDQKIETGTKQPNLICKENAIHFGPIREESIPKPKDTCVIQEKFPEIREISNLVQRVPDHFDDIIDSSSHKSSPFSSNKESHMIEKTSFNSSINEIFETKGKALEPSIENNIHDTSVNEKLDSAIKESFNFTPDNNIELSSANELKDEIDQLGTIESNKSAIKDDSIFPLSVNEASESQFFDISLQKSSRSNYSISGVSLPDSTHALLDAYRRNSIRNQPWETPSEVSKASAQSTSEKSKLSERLSQLIDTFKKQKNSSTSFIETVRPSNENSIRIISQSLSESKRSSGDEYRAFNSAKEEEIINDIDMHIKNLDKGL